MSGLILAFVAVLVVGVILLTMLIRTHRKQRILVEPVVSRVREQDPASFALFMTVDNGFEEVIKYFGGVARNVPKGKWLVLPDEIRARLTELPHNSGYVIETIGKWEDWPPLPGQKLEVDTVVVNSELHSFVMCVEAVRAEENEDDTVPFTYDHTSQTVRFHADLEASMPATSLMPLPGACNRYIICARPR